MELLGLIAGTKSGLNFLAFLVALVAAYAGQKIRLVCDNGHFHQTKAVFRWLGTHRDQVEIYWLPPYCPSLNLIEQLWGHLKRTVLAMAMCSLPQWMIWLQLFAEVLLVSMAIVINELYP